MRKLLLGLFLCGVACSHARPQGCLDDREIIADVHAVASNVTPWTEITPDVFVEILPHRFDSGSQNRGQPNEPCSGSTEFIRHDRVTSGECQCCFLTIFAQHVKAGGCTESLNAFVVRQTEPSREVAEGFARSLLAEIAPPGTGDRPDVVGHYYWEDFPKQRQKTSAELDLSRVGNGWHVYLWVSRDTAPN